MQISPSEHDKRALLRIARKTISKGCEGFPPELEAQDAEQSDLFKHQGACFVTLQKHGNLRGCIGSTQAHRALLDDVVQNAFASAFRDPRFPLVTENELTEISVEISILTPQEQMQIDDEKDLLKQLRPGTDGLLIRNADYSATFLPQVWKQLPNPRQFLAHLKNKAGISPGLWPKDMECFRYQCIKFQEK